MSPSYDFKMPETFVPRPMPPPMPPPPAPPPFNPNVGGRIRMPEPDEGEDLSDLMQYYQPQPPMYVSPVGTVNPVPSMFGGVTMPPGSVSGYVPPVMVGPGQQLPTITSGQGVGPDPRYRPYTPSPEMDYTPPMAPALRAPNGYNPLYGSIIPNFNTVYPNPPVTVADPFPPPPSRPALIEPMPMRRPMPSPPPFNPNVGGRIRVPEPDEPEPEGNAFFTL